MILALKIDVDTLRGTREGVPNLVELLRRHVQLVERAVRIDAHRVALQHEGVLADGGLDLVRRLVQLREDLPLHRLVRLEARRHLERLDGVGHLLQAIAIDQA